MSAIERRTEQVREQLRRVGALDNGEPLLFAAVICNGCGAIVSADTAAELELQTRGWAIGEAFGDDDVCPACR